MTKELAQFIVACVLAILLVPISGGLYCPSGTDSYYNQESNVWVCCEDITCDKGYQAMPCEKGNTTSSWCKKCDADQTFSDRNTSLKDRTKCRHKKRCHVFFLKGDETTDAICHCPEKWHHLEDDMCLPNKDCIKGWGQTDSGHCERCQHGVTYSNETNNHQRCMPVRRCKDEYRCTIREANITSNAICTENVISDIENCPKPGEVTSTVAAKPTTADSEKNSFEPKSDIVDGDRSKERKTSPKPKPPKTESSDGDIAVRVVVSLLAIAVVVLLLVLAIKAFRKERYRMHLAIVEHLENVLVINRKQESVKVYEVVHDYLIDEMCRHWRSLGENLIGEKLAGIESELRREPSDRERMHYVLETWKESCCSDGPNMGPLFSAMYSPDRNWWIPYSPLRSRIISQCNLPIPREHNISCLRRLCRMEWLYCLPYQTCTGRHSHSNRSRSTSQHNASQSVSNSTVDSQYRLMSYA